MRNIILLFILLEVTGSIGNAQDSIPKMYPLESWRACQIPTDSLTFAQYGHCQDDWAVFKKDGKPYAMDRYYVHVKEIAPESDSIPKVVMDIIMKNDFIIIRSQRRFLSVENGYLIAFYGGELGKGLFWFSSDGKEYYKLSEENIFEFIKNKDQIYAIQGLIYGHTSYGSLINISKNKELNKWFAYTDHTLPYGPIGIDTNSRGNFVIATTNGLQEIAWNERYINIIQDGFWDSHHLMANSMVIINDVVYIGMRHGVFKMDLNTKKQEWLMKD